jgi:hypothetical protein
MKPSAGLVLCLSLAPACAYRYIERRVDALNQVVEEATRAGAATCAPVELALSRVHLEFARHELEDGDAPRAERHLTLAEPNGQAALRLAKEHKCSPRSARARNRALRQALEPQGSPLTTSSPSASSLLSEAREQYGDGDTAYSVAPAQRGVGHEKR